MLLRLAWRNIWRNKRRTYITVASIMFAVFAAIAMSSIQRGAWGHMVDNVVKYYFGYAQIQKDGYWEEQSIDKAFLMDEEVKALQTKLPHVKDFIPRIESFALASYKKSTLGVLVVGTNGEKENAMTKLGTRITKGTYLQPGEKGAIIADGIAENLKIGVGDTLVLLSVGYRGANAAGKYPVKGLVHFGSPELNKRMVYLPLEEAQYFFAADGLVTSIALDIDDKKNIEPTILAVKSKLNQDKYDVLNWKEMIPSLVEAKQLDEAGAKIMLLILYVIIAFGIFGTILMMTKEREYEFGVLLAIGMHRMKLGLTIWVETILLGILGAVAGMLFSFPIVYYFYKQPITMTGDMAKAYEKFGVEPILPAALGLDIFLIQALIVFLMTSVLAIYPLLKIRGLRPVEAMRE